MDKILIATNNRGKFNEISSLLASFDIEAIFAGNYIDNLKIVEPEETANSFAENSLIKAKYYAKMLNLKAIADDSGFCIELLDGLPGVHSARFAIDDYGVKNFPQAFNKIAEMLENKGINPYRDKIKAYFICNLSLFNPFDEASISFEGRVDGFLSLPPRGSNGFGYDPIFIKQDMQQTFAEIDHDLKESISHRALAFKQLSKFLK